MSDKSKPDKIKQVQDKVDETTQIINKNIEIVIARGEQLDTLTDKAENLEQQSIVFKKKATGVRRMFQWRNIKSNCVIFGIVATIIAVIVLIIVLA